jgi:hypothetical protein
MRIGVALVVVFALAAVAHADGTQKWAEGVSETQKQNAQNLLEAGNKAFLAQQYKDALEKYQAAVKEWDHPAIRFNIVRCLIQLDRPVEASDNLQLALKYGAEPLEEAVYQEALSYQKLLANQIADVEISCNQDGAQITLDGQPLIDKCPGKEKRRVAPGQHGVVATKDGFLTKQLEIVVVGGKTEAVDVKLVPLAKAAKIVHKWPAWIPWVVFGSGMTVAAFGGFIEYSAASTMNDFDNRVATNCAMNGCDLSDTTNQMYVDLNKTHARAERLDKIGITVISIGAVGAVAGGVMLVMNRGKTVYDNSVEKRGPMGAQLNYMPREGGGVLTLSGAF